MPSGSPSVTIVSRRRLHEQLDDIEALYEATIRELIVDQRRVDVLARDVLGYTLNWHHLLMLQHQFEHSWGLALAWRGSGKTLMRTVVKAIHQIVLDPNRRIIFGSRSAKNARDSLAAVKQHLERNEKFRAIFGDFVGDNWNLDEITVKGRRSIHREATISVISPDTAVASRHANDLFADDLWDEETSRTALQRDKLEKFFWKTCIPVLEQDDHNVWLTNTRYHPNDLGWALGAPPALGSEREAKEGPLNGSATLIIPAIYLDEDGEERSSWPDKFSLGYLRKLRSGSRISFESQYQQNVRPMAGGGLIKYDEINRISLHEVPEGLPKYLGVDLAIGQKKQHDEFWAIVGAYDKATGNIYAIDKVSGRFSFSRQREIILELCDRHDIVRGVVEAVGYQSALIDHVKAKDALVPIVPYAPTVDKFTRLQRRTPLFENGQVFVVNGMDALIDQLVAFTGDKGRKDDAVDAWDLMVRAIQTKKKKPRPEPGLF